MKHFFKRSLPPVTHFKAHPQLQFLGKRLHEPNLWHLNRHALAGGTAVGLFTAFIPIPLQMFLAAALALYFRVNLPLSVSLIWLTNPLTIPPLFYCAYYIGSLLLDMPIQSLEFNFSSEWLLWTFKNFWQPLLLGCLVLGMMSALTGYLLIHGLWRLQVVRLWRQRCAHRRQKKHSILTTAHAKK